ncbi:MULTISPECIES: phasin family protein [Neptunomonas]|uniref:Phasin family protein n=1 Tax=Neptunomonas qingdaonensis TaxID=1045558 RepID=A0A1I2QCB0_9GAMM|nr:phasin family protein [Neptunomonas qingdaonensis]SFG25019.1 phasin family protein [Neptunomonas qingdaonensis]
MRQDIMKDIQESFVPITVISDINKSAAEKLIAIQSDYMTDLFNTGLAQMQTLSSVKEPKEAFELQIKYFKELDAKLANVTEKEVAMLSATKEQLLDVIEQHISEMSDIFGMADATGFMQDAQKKLKR